MGVLYIYVLDLATLLEVISAVDIANEERITSRGGGIGRMKRIY